MSKPYTIAIIDDEGSVIDSFPVFHYKDTVKVNSYDDFENFGSPASEAMLKERILRYLPEFKG